MAAAAAAVSTAGEAGRSLSLPSVADDRLTVHGVVARIAYLSSDVVISVQPSLSADSAFSATFKTLASSNASGIVTKIPEVCPPGWTHIA